MSNYLIISALLYLPYLQVSCFLQSCNYFALTVDAGYMKLNDLNRVIVFISGIFLYPVSVCKWFLH